jgi:hypothetical protein
MQRLLELWFDIESLLAIVQAFQEHLSNKVVWACDALAASSKWPSLNIFRRGSLIHRSPHHDPRRSLYQSSRIQDVIEKTIFADIHIDGGWPTPDEMISRNAILDEIDQMGLGQFVGAGDSIGSVDFSYRVADAATARRTIESLIRKHLPNHEYTVDVSDK